MRTTLQSLLAIGALLIAPATLRAQDVSDEENPSPPSHWAINLTVGGTGLSIGNSARVNGLRINWSDRDLDRVNGINLTLWRPYKHLSGTINGAAIGIAGPGAEEINGLAIGVAGVVTERRLRGLSIAGLGVVSQGSIAGISLAGLGAVAQGSLKGISIAGLGVVSEGGISGIALSGLGTVSQGPMSGIAFAGLGAVSQGDATGILIGGLGTVSEGRITGFAASGLGTVAEGGLMKHRQNRGESFADWPWVSRTPRRAPVRPRRTGPRAPASR